MCIKKDYQPVKIDGLKNQIVSNLRYALGAALGVGAFSFGGLGAFLTAGAPPEPLLPAASLAPPAL